MGGGGGMRARKGDGTTDAKELRKSIFGDESISEVTRQELLGKIGSADRVSVADFKETESELATAKEGKDPKYKGRQFQKSLGTALSDRPGSSQTLLTR